MHENRHNVKNTLNKWDGLRHKVVLDGIIVGIFGGLLVVLYRIALQEAENLSRKLYSLQIHKYWLIPIWFVLLVLLAYIVGIMVKKDYMISGSGIPQLEGVLNGHLKMNWWKVIIRKFLGGVMSIGAGLSLGREGPSIQLGAAVGQGVSRILKKTRIEEKYLITSGASAGLAAAFNAPFAGAIFALEEIHKNFSPVVLLSAMSASVTADFVSKEFFGLKPVFQFKNLSILPLKYYLYIIIFGVIIGILGALYNYVLIKAQKAYGYFSWMKTEFKPIIPFVLAGVLGLVLPEVLGGGHELMVLIINRELALKVIIVILIVKFIFSMISFGSGAPGGIFFPLLVIGAIIGCIYGNALSYMFGFDSTYINNFLILGMTGYFTAIVRAPITGIVLITEMTGSFTHLLSLSIVSIIAYIVADLANSKPVYEALLDRILEIKKNFNIPKNNIRKTIIEIVVHAGSLVDGKKVKDFAWPENCLLVFIKRGEKEIIPRGDTKLIAGDYLGVLINESDTANIIKKLNTISEIQFIS